MRELPRLLRIWFGSTEGELLLMGLMLWLLLLLLLLLEGLEVKTTEGLDNSKKEDCTKSIVCFNLEGIDIKKGI